MKLFKHFSYRSVLFLGFMIIAVSFVIWSNSFMSSVEFETGTITLPDGSNINVEVADSAAEQRQGLMDREKLDPESGMLFLFSISDTHSFWMKNTRFDLDFIWLSEGKVVDLRTQVPAGAGLPVDQIAQVQPQVPVDAVLEVPAGFIVRHQIQVGDQLIY